MAYTRYFMAVTPPMRKQIKRKRKENGQSRSLALIESLIKPHIETTPQATSFWGVFLEQFAIRFISYGLVKNERIGGCCYLG
jgi:hypothetical protein